MLHAMIIGGLLATAIASYQALPGRSAHTRKNVVNSGSPQIPHDIINRKSQYRPLNFSSDTELTSQLCHTQAPSVLQVLWITVATWRNVARLHLCLASILSQQPPTAPHGMAVKILVNEDHSEDMLSAAERLAYQAKGDFIFTTTQDCTTLSGQPGILQPIF